MILVISSTREIYAINDQLKDSLPKAQETVLIRRKGELIKKIQDTIKFVYEMRV